MSFDDAVEIVAGVNGYPRWVARLLVELMVLESRAAGLRIQALG